jgi:23S rRNA pseudouridine955/2504/2580 synthase
LEKIPMSVFARTGVVAGMLHGVVMDDVQRVVVCQVDAANAGRRVDALVRKLLPEVPLAQIMKLIRLGAVRLNKKRCRGAARVCEGDSLSWSAAIGASPAAAPPAAPTPLLLPVLYEDESILVVDKPAGLACHAGTGHATESVLAQVAQYLGSANAPVGHKPGLAQRLDRGVSGVLVIGKNTAALRALSADVEMRRAHKTYLACVQGAVRRARGSIEAPLHVGDQPMGNLPRTVVDPAGKPAHTDYQVVRRLRDATLLEVTLRTGRTHQIRAHLRHIGHPILGDARYGDDASTQYFRETFGLLWPFLHAGKLTLLHPLSRAPLVFEAPLPARAEAVLTALQLPGSHLRK